MVAQKKLLIDRNKFHCGIDHFQKNIKFLEGNKECFYYWDGVKKSSNVTAWRARDILFFLLLRQNDNSLSAEPANIEAP